MPHSDSPSSSVESSPNAPRRFLPLHILKTLSPSKQAIPIVSDSNSDSEDESLPIQASYYTSPSRPEKRQHLSVPSPRMARLSIEGPTRRFTPSIPGYGQGTQKTIRMSAAPLTRLGSLDTFQRSGMRGRIPVSFPGLLNPMSDSRRPDGNF